MILDDRLLDIQFDEARINGFRFVRQITECSAPHICCCRSRRRTLCRDPTMTCGALDFVLRNEIERRERESRYYISFEEFGHFHSEIK